MRTLPLAALGIIGVALSFGASTVAQSSNLLESKDKAYGYVDLKTGLFHPEKEPAATPDTAVPPKTFTGTLVTTFAITIDAALPKGTTILCDVDTTSNLDGLTYTDVASSPATISGAKATCTVKLAYSWTGPGGGAPASYDLVGATYKVTATSVPSATQPITDFNVIRQANGPIPKAQGLDLPASGTVTDFTVDATI